ncbi:hypothetical protein N9A76_03380 [Mariniblastus sp.]|nr:hypothetical protein [Mariniblastus sp.]
MRESGLSFNPDSYWPTGSLDYKITGLQEVIKTQRSALTEELEATQRLGA